MRKFVAAVIVATAMGVAAQDTSAQGVGFGVQGSFGSDTDLGVGARVVFPLESVLPRLSGAASFDYFFPGDGDFAFGDNFDWTYWEINANGHYAIPLSGSNFAPYVGGGLNFAKISVDVDEDICPACGEASSSEIGLNVLAGARMRNLFGEARFELGGGEQFVLTIGFLFGGRRE